MKLALPLAVLAVSTFGLAVAHAQEAVVGVADAEAALGLC